MRVGVEETVDEHHFVEEVRNVVHDFYRVDLVLKVPVRVINRVARLEVHDQWENSVKVVVKGENGENCKNGETGENGWDG